MFFGIFQKIATLVEACIPYRSLFNSNCWTGSCIRGLDTGTMYRVRGRTVVAAASPTQPPAADTQGPFSWPTCLFSS